MTMEPPTAEGPLAPEPNPWRPVPRGDAGGRSSDRGWDAVEQPEPTRLLPEERLPEADVPTQPGRYAYPSAADYVYPPEGQSVEAPAGGRYAYPAAPPGQSDAVWDGKWPNRAGEAYPPSQAYPPGQTYPPGPPAYPQFHPHGYQYPAPGVPIDLGVSVTPGGWQPNPGAAGQPSGWHGHRPGPPDAWSAAPPPPLSGQPPSQQPATKSRAWLLALGVLVVVTVFGLMSAVAVPRFVDLPAAGGRVQPSPAVPTPRTSPITSTTRTPTATATASATVTPKATPSPDKSRATMPASAGDRLKKNPIYTLKVPAKCPSQSRPGSEAAFRKQVKGLVDCQNKAWAKALATISGVTFSKPTVKFYNSSTKSPCGRLGTTYPASYCSGNRTLYFSKASYQQGRYYRTSVAHFVIHEYAHHVQELAQVFDSIFAMDENSAVTTRRIELQAHCMAHYGLTHSSIDYNSFDREDAEYQFDYTTDAKGHGSTKAERYWGVRGLDADTIGACNTWKVKASKVK